jgi:hypothetical protein
MATAKKSAPLTTKKRNSLAGSTYAFPKERKEPLNNASHVRNAIARFAQVKDVSESERGAALGKIKSAAKKFGVNMTETGASDPGKKQSPKKTAKKAAKKAAKKTAKKSAKKTAKR